MKLNCPSCKQKELPFTNSYGRPNKTGNYYIVLEYYKPCVCTKDIYPAVIFRFDKKGNIYNGPL